ncbi:MAG TPA: protein phosphatase 2C domain-containing protein [Burkholderiaceae bacterium]|nr:protein phosphatase 2C domain-containing protein [Burkholderiaceae bacterium]
MPDIQFASRSEIGARKGNEDYLQHGTLEHGWFAVLSDGAGGHNDGAVAADLVVRMVVHELSVEFAHTAALPALEQVVHVANDALNRRQQGLSGVQRMHATLVVLWIDKTREQAVWAHVGDSRLYLLRKGRITKVTRDDSVVQTMLDAGLIDAEQARHHTQRNQLIAAMGAEEPIEPHLSAADFAIADGDAFLLCSDGWYDPLEPEEIESTLADAADAHDWLARMHLLVQQRARPNQDNYSAIAVWVGDPAAVTRIRDAD